MVLTRYKKESYKILEVKREWDDFQYDDGHVSRNIFSKNKKSRLKEFQKAPHDGKNTITR